MTTSSCTKLIATIEINKRVMLRALSKDASEVAMKNIILSTDGTGNAGGIGHGSNVWRLHTAIDRQGHLNNANAIRHIAYYHDGVGSQDSKWLKIIGGAFGYGLKRTILDMYTFLVNNYEPGDQLYLFGFSRGAYTVRLLAGMILACGILNKKNYQQVADEVLDKDVKNTYRMLKELIICEKEQQLAKQNTPFTFAHFLRKKFQKISHKLHPLNELPGDNYTDLKIRFMGVWDTVDAYAIPSDTLAAFLDKLFYVSFREHDNNLNESVESACHALSIDDQRRTFEPVLWRENPENNDHQRIHQVWFSGVHSNVGGGYPKQGMAWNTLEWMMLHAKVAGLRFVTEDILQFTENKDVHDKMYDSRSGFGAYYVFKPRNISKLWENYTSITSKPRIHISVFERIALRTEGYAPRNLPEEFEICVTRPLCTDEKGSYGDGKDENKASDSENSLKLSAQQNDIYCVQYEPAEISALKKQVLTAIKEHIAKMPARTLFQRFTSFIHRWSSYFFFFGMTAIWVLGYFNFEQNLKTFGTSLLISIIYWFSLWQISHIDKVRKHQQDSSFWRQTSAHQAWDFLRR